MKLIAIPIACLGLISAASGQTGAPDRRPEIQVRGRVDSIEVNAAGEIWFGTLLGKVYVTRDWNRSWDEAAVPVRSEDDAPTSVDLDNISQVRFFDARRAILAGYIGDSQDQVYRTVDGGASWASVTLPTSLWVYEARATKQGLAWLVGSSGDLLVSDDFGATWSARTPPFDQVERSNSVDFASRSVGVVGSLHGSLKVTRDGGRSWSSIPTPSEKRIVKCKEDRIERVRLLGSAIVLAQCDAVFVRPASRNGAWSELRAGGSPLLWFETTGQGMTAVTSDLRIVRCSGDLITCAPTELRLPGQPLDVAVGTGKVVFLDDAMRLSVFDGATLSSSHLFGSGTTPAPPIVARDRGSDGAFWGVSRYFLYRSADAGGTWERQAEFPSPVDGVALQASGDLLIWSRHGFVTRWNRKTARLESVPGLAGLDIVGLFRRGNIWLAYGGMQAQTTQRIEVARTYFSGEFAGSADHGFVAASSDGGQTWSVVDEWKDGGVQQIFLGEDGTLTLLSWLCSVRRGRLSIDPSGRLSASLATILPATQENRKSVPYVEEAHALDFLAGEEGWIRGWTHHLGDFVFRSGDGGRTWQSADAATRPVDRLHRLGNGTWLGLTPDGDVRRWDGYGFVPLRKFDREIGWSLVDATGGLLLQLEGGDLWSYDQVAGAWRRLAPPDGGR